MWRATTDTCRRGSSQARLAVLPKAFIFWGARSSRASAVGYQTDSQRRAKAAVRNGGAQSRYCSVLKDVIPTATTRNRSDVAVLVCRQGALRRTTWLPFKRRNAVRRAGKGHRRPRLETVLPRRRFRTILRIALQSAPCRTVSKRGRWVRSYCGWYYWRAQVPSRRSCRTEISSARACA